MVTSTDQPTIRQGEYSAICLFQKLENRKKGRDLQENVDKKTWPTNIFFIISDMNKKMRQTHCRYTFNGNCQWGNLQFWPDFSILNICRNIDQIPQFLQYFIILNGYHTLVQISQMSQFWQGDKNTIEIVWKVALPKQETPEKHYRHLSVIGSHMNTCTHTMWTCVHVTANHA